MDAKKQYVNHRYYITKAIKSGKLKKPSKCEGCNRSGIKINAHHEDYTKRYDVIWLCNRCHIRTHHNIPLDKPSHVQKKSKPSHEKEDFVIHGRHIRLPLINKSPFVNKGLIVNEGIIDEHKYFEESYEWEYMFTKLTYREKKTIELRYGFEDGYCYTLEEIGQIYKLSRERVRQLEARAIRKLQHYFYARMQL